MKKILAKLRFFRRFDPRLAAELRKQRKAILTGLACVVIGALLDGLLLPLVAKSVTLIQDAAPLKLQQEHKQQVLEQSLNDQAEKIAENLQVPTKTVKAAFHDIAGRIGEGQDDVTARFLAQWLGLPAPRVKAALANMASIRPTGNIEKVRALAWCCVLVVVLFGARYWFIRGQVYYLSKASARLTSDLRFRLFSKLQRLPVAYFSDKRAGAIQSVLTNDVNVYQLAVAVVRDSISAPVTAAVSLGFVIYWEWRLALIAIVFLPPMVMVINRNGRRMKKSQATVQDDLSELSAVTTEALQGIRVIKAFAAEQRVEATYSKEVEKSYDSQIRAMRILASLRPLVELIGSGAIAAVLLACGWLAYKGELDLGIVAGLMLCLDRINQSLKSLGGVTSTYKQVEAASDRIYTEVLDVPDQVIDTSAGRTLPAVAGRVEFRNVSFAYPDGTQALHKVSFTIEPGTSLALVGPSGAGKSTIADLLLRFYDPSEGQILLDGIDLRDLQISWLRSHIGVVPQQTFLFAGSVADNIRMGKPDATMDEIRSASQSAYADEFVVTMDGAYDAELGETGIRLSGGQRQRIAIARALVREPAVLLLDEATSALDASSEKAVTEALDVIMKERTTLYIAHRLTTAARADRILVLSRGEVVELGSHAELMELDGAYAGLFRAFSGGLLE